METARTVEQVRPGTEPISAPFRNWELAAYLDDPERIAPQFEKDQFVAGDQIVVDSDLFAKERFTGTESSPFAIDIHVPQRRGRFQVISFVPSATGAIQTASVAGSNEARAGDPTPMLDRRVATAWTIGKAKAGSGNAARIRFKIDSGAGCDALFLYSADRQLSDDLKIVAKESGQRRKLQNDKIHDFFGLLKIDLASFKPDEVSVKIGRAAGSFRERSVV